MTATTTPTSKVSISFDIYKTIYTVTGPSAKVIINFNELFATWTAYNLTAGHYMENDTEEFGVAKAWAIGQAE